MTAKHPYGKFEKNPLWPAIDKTIQELEKNRDIILTTSRDLVIGYICEQLTELKLIPNKSTSDKKEAEQGA